MNKNKRILCLVIVLLMVGSVLIVIYFTDAFSEYRDGRISHNKKRAFEALCINLPPISRVDILELGGISAQSSNSFKVEPHKLTYQIVKQSSLYGKDAENIAIAWRNNMYGGPLVMGHRPETGLRFYNKTNLILETTISWDTANFWLKTGWNDFFWVPFLTDSTQANNLRALLRRHGNP